MLSCLVLVFLSACATGTPDESPDEEQAVRAALRQLESTVNEGDLDGWLSLLTDDAVWMPPNEEAREGKPAILDWLQPWFDQFDMHMRWNIEGIEVSDTWAVAWGTGEFQSTPKGGGESTGMTIKWVDILQHQADGSWKFVRRIYNSNTPLQE